MHSLQPTADSLWSLRCSLNAFMARRDWCRIYNPFHASVRERRGQMKLNCLLSVGSCSLSTLKKGKNHLTWDKTEFFFSLPGPMSETSKYGSYWGQIEPKLIGSGVKPRIQKHSLMNCAYNNYIPTKNSFFFRHKRGTVNHQGPWQISSESSLQWALTATTISITSPTTCPLRPSQLVCRFTSMFDIPDTAHWNVWAVIIVPTSKIPNGKVHSP